MNSRRRRRLRSSKKIAKTANVPLSWTGRLFGKGSALLDQKITLRWARRYPAFCSDTSENRA
jgi:hypothetical protein